MDNIYISDLQDKMIISKYGIKKNRYGLDISSKDKQLVNEGAIVLFKSGYSNGLWGTRWRYVKKNGSFYNSYVATTEMLDYLTQIGESDIFKPSRTCVTYRDL